MTTVWYSCGKEPRYRFILGRTYDITRQDECSDIAKQCAKHYYNCQGGWAVEWPCEFKIYEDEYGPAVATFLLKCRQEIVFTARRA